MSPWLWLLLLCDNTIRYTICTGKLVGKLPKGEVRGGYIAHNLKRTKNVLNGNEMREIEVESPVM